MQARIRPTFLSSLDTCRELIFPVSNSPPKTCILHRPHPPPLQPTPTILMPAFSIPFNRLSPARTLKLVWLITSVTCTQVIVIFSTLILFFVVAGKQLSHRKKPDISSPGIGFQCSSLNVLFPKELVVSNARASEQSRRQYQSASSAVRQSVPLRFLSVH